MNHDLWSDESAHFTFFMSHIYAIISITINHSLPTISTKPFTSRDLQIFP